ncbi:MAG TPA: hypothetical protein PLN52_14125 [Opitutaceae bacterium]|nr:hypothetical protein [Opitutaceae bacterium]
MSNDDDFSDLERELKQLRLREPSAGFLERIEQALDADLANAPRHYEVHWGGWITAGLPIAAAVVFGFLAAQAPTQRQQARDGTREAIVAGDVSSSPETFTAERRTQPSLYKPVAVEQWDYGAHDEGIVTLPDGTTARQWRERFVDTVTWKNPQTQAAVTWSIPRDEVRLVPVRAY